MKSVRCILLILCAFVIAGYGIAGAQEVNYSGTWVLDKAKSDLQGRMMESLQSITLVIAQTGNDITADYQSKYSERESNDKMVLTIGGAEVSREGMRGRGTIKSKAAWSADKKNLVVTSVSTFEGQNGTMTINGTDTYLLSADGNTLTVNRQSESPRGTRTSTLVFNKQ